MRWAFRSDDEAQGLVGQATRPLRSLVSRFLIGSDATYLASAGVGECIDASATRVHLAALVDLGPPTPPRAKVQRRITVQHHRSKSSVKRYQFLQKGASSDDVGLEGELPKYASATEVTEDAPPEPVTIQAVIIDVSASLVSFLITAVIYVSTAQSVVGKLDPRLIGVVVDQAMLGTAISGIYLALRSKVPWAIAALDVGFAPLLTQLSDVCWAGTVAKKHHKNDEPWSWTADGEAMYDHVTHTQRRVFLATYVAASSLTFLISGIILFSLGSLRLTKVVEFLPYPVTAGMLASIGVSLLKSGARVAAFGGWRQSAELGFFWLLLALSAAYSLRKLRQIMSPYFATPLLLFASIALLRMVAYILAIPTYELKNAGLLFRWDDEMLDESKAWFAWQALTPKGFLRHIKWHVLFDCRGVASAAVVISIIKIAMKTGSFAALFPAAEIDVDAEVSRVGLAGNIVPSLFLSSGQAYSFSSLKVAQQLGASERGVGVIASLLCFAAWFCGFGVLKHIPRFVYGALLLDLGWDYVEAYFLTPLVRRKEFLSADALTVVVIVAIATATSLLEAIAVGVVLCLISTASKLAGESVIAESRTGKNTRSTIERTPVQNAVLDEVGDDVKVLALRGYLFFGSASELMTTCRQNLTTLEEMKRRRYLLLDVSQCFGKFDATAVSAFEQIAEMARHKNYEILMAPASKLQLEDIKLFETADDALEYAEDALLTLHHKSPRAAAKKIAEPPRNLMRSWLEAANATRVDELSDHLHTQAADRHYSANDLVYRLGDPSDEAFLLICSGRFRLLNQYGQVLRKLAPGSAVSVGDYYVAPQARKIVRQHSLVAATTAILLRLPYSALAELERHYPAAALHFHKLMASTLTTKNRNSLLAFRPAPHHD